MPSRLILLLAVLLLAVAASCNVDTEPVPEPAGETPAELEWERTDIHPDDLKEPAKPLRALRDGRLLLNLPYLPNFTVTHLDLGDGILEVTIEFEEDDRYHDPWTYAGNPAALIIEGVDLDAVQDIRVVDTRARAVNLEISLGEAVGRVRDFVEADFGSPTAFRLAFTGDADGPAVLTYYLDYVDDQVIDGGGTSAVSGWFNVCAGTGEITECSVTRVPMAGRTFLDHAVFLAWTAEGHLLVLRGQDLLLYDVEGGIHREIPGSVPEGLTFILLDEDRAHFSLEGRECVAVCLATGVLHDSWCPDPPTLPGEVTETEAEGADGEIVSRERRVSLALDSMSLEIRSRELLPAEASSLEITVYRDDGGTLEVPTEILGEYTVLRCWHPCEPHSIIYFSTEIFGPRYGMWVTEYALWQMVPGEGSLRRLSFMPSPDFDICPKGEFGVYQHGGRIFVVDLVQGK